MTKHDMEQDLIIKELKEELKSKSKWWKQPLTIVALAVAGIIVFAVFSGNPLKGGAEYGDAKVWIETGEITQ